MGRPSLYNSTRLAQWLKAKGRNRVDFATELGCSAWRVSALCKGEKPSGELALKIVKATDGAVTLDDLFGVMAEPGAAA